MASSLLDSIQAVSRAADRLLIACASHEVVVFDADPKPLGRALRRAFKTSMVTPFDMTEQLRKLK